MHRGRPSRVSARRDGQRTSQVPHWLDERFLSRAIYRAPYFLSYQPAELFNERNLRGIRRRHYSLRRTIAQLLYECRLYSRAEMLTVK